MPDQPDTVRSCADGYVDRLAALDPAAARALGRTPASPLPDVGPEAGRRRRDLAADTLGQLRAAVVPDQQQEVLRAAMAERLAADVALHDSGFTPGLVAPLASPAHTVLHALRSVAAEEQPSALADVPHALAQIRASLDAAAADGYAVPARQSRVLAAQLRRWADADGDDQVGEATTGLAPRHTPLVDGVRAALREHADWLEKVHAPRGRPVDAAGAELYAVTSSAFLGAEVDLAETYAHGWDRLAELTSEGMRLAERLGHSDIGAAERALDADPAGRVAVGPELVDWVEGRIAGARDALAGRYFHWPSSPLGAVEARLAPPGSGSIFYSPPDPLGTRPGQVVWSTPEGAADVPVWREVSTVHHEGVPGHHLQHVVTMTQEHLHPWQRHLCHVHGYAEGWAHYTEGRADDWGLLHDDGERLGVVLAQRWRAARVVVDLGLHVGEELGLAIPEGNGLTSAQGWSPTVGREVLVSATGMDPGTARFEVDRYLGWPGQALAFSVGARLWEQARSRSLGPSATAEQERDWHAAALALGPMGLGPLAQVLSA